MTFAITNAAGEVLRTFVPVPVGCSPTTISLGYTATGCSTWTSNPAACFSPDGDCHNDLLKIVFPELTDPRYPLGWDGVWWDGKTDAGAWVVDGTYFINVATVDTTGLTVVLTRSVTACNVPKPPSPPPDPGQVQIHLPNPGDYFNIGLGTTAGFVVRPKGSGDIHVRLYDLKGRLVRDLHESSHGSDPVAVAWDGKDHQGNLVSAGVYAVFVEAPGIRHRDKIAVFR